MKPILWMLVGAGMLAFVIAVGFVILVSMPDPAQRW